MSKASTDESAIETYHEKYGIPKIPLSHALKHIERDLKHGIRRGVYCLVSDAGVGKSQGIRQLARKYDYRIVDIRTAQFTLMTAGIPQRAENGFFKIAVPDDFPKPGEKCILLFDEINQGTPHALAMFFKLMEDRGMFDYSLPEDTLVVSLMNPSTGGYSVSKIETNPALTRRMRRFYVYNTVNDWKKYAATEDFHFDDHVIRGKPCHPWVLKFVSAVPNLLYAAKDKDANKSFACPATWQTVSAALYTLEMDGVGLTTNNTKELIGSVINTTVAETFIDYIKNNELIVSPEEVLSEYATLQKLRDRVLKIQTEDGGKYLSLLSNVAVYLFDSKPEPDKMAENLVDFMYDMRGEEVSNFFGQLNTIAGEDSEARTYMTDMTKALLNNEKWHAVLERHESAFLEIKRKVGKTKGPKDPLKKS